MRISDWSSDVCSSDLVVGERLDPPAVDLVGHAHLHLVEGVEDVELGDRHLREGVEAHRVAQHHGVEPAGPALAAGVGPVLVAPLDERVADLVDQLRWEGAGADAGDVGLGHTDDAVDVQWAEQNGRASGRERVWTYGKI